MKLNVLPFGSIFIKNSRKPKKWSTQELATNRIELRLRAVELVQAMESCYKAGREINTYHANDLQTCRRVFSSAMSRFEQAQESADQMGLSKSVLGLLESIHSLAHCLASQPNEQIDPQEIKRFRALVDELKVSLDY